MIGFAGVILLWTEGRIMGLSGIIRGTIEKTSEPKKWRFSFIVGVLTGAILITPLGFSVMSIPVDRSLILIGLGGVFVGFGTSIGSGCTSGHGVCGISRFSQRSMIATLVFMATGVASVFILKILGVG